MRTTKRPAHPQPKAYCFALPRPSLEQAEVPPHSTLIDRSVVMLSAGAAVLGIAAGFVAQALMALIGLITNIAFYGRIG